MTTLTPRASLDHSVPFPEIDSRDVLSDATGSPLDERLRRRVRVRRPMEGSLEHGVAVLLRLPFAMAQGLLPPGLEPVRRGDWALATVVAGQVSDLCPEGALPGSACDPSGNGGGLLSLRIAAQVFTRTGEALRGAYAIHTYADSVLTEQVGAGDAALRMRSGRLSLSGPIGTPSNRTGDRIAWQLEGTRRGQAESLIDLNPTHPARPRGSCFATPVDAREFLLDALSAPMLARCQDQVHRRSWWSSKSQKTLRPIPMSVERLRLTALDRIVGKNGPADAHDLSPSIWAVELAASFGPIAMHWQPLSSVTPMNGGPLQDEPMPVRDDRSVNR